MTAASTDFLPRREDLHEASSTLSLLSNPARLEILCHLSRHGELSVGEIGTRMDLSQSSLSQHLAKLRKARLVERRRDRQTQHYRIARADVGRILDLMHELYCGNPGGT